MKLEFSSDDIVHMVELYVQNISDKCMFSCSLYVKEFHSFVVIFSRATIQWRLII
jgi:hypothetical protein